MLEKTLGLTCSPWETYCFANQECFLGTKWWRRPIGCLVFRGHFPQKSPTVRDSFAERDLRLQTSYASWPLFNRGGGLVLGIDSKYKIEHIQPRPFPIHACARCTAGRLQKYYRENRWERAGDWRERREEEKDGERKGEKASERQRETHDTAGILQKCYRERRWGHNSLYAWGVCSTVVLVCQSIYVISSLPLRTH